LGHLFISWQEAHSKGCSKLFKTSTHQGKGFYSCNSAEVHVAVVAVANPFCCCCLLLLLLLLQADTVAALQAVIAEGEADHMPVHLRAYRIAQLNEHFK
jgi:hypothetical protein